MDAFVKEMQDILRAQLAAKQKSGRELLQDFIDHQTTQPPETPKWIVLSGVGVKCNYCLQQLDYPESGSQAEWHDLLEKFIQQHSACDLWDGL